MTHHDGRTDDTRDDWETPASIFDPLDREFEFTLDVAATAETAKCSEFFSLERSAFENDWHGNCWMNPEYGRELPTWMDRAVEQVQHNADLVVCLVPSRTDTRWWHRVVFESGKCSWVRFIKGRLKFLVGGVTIGTAPFASALIVLDRWHQGASPLMTAWDPRLAGQSRLFD